jgi:hypothetical protein
MRTRTQTSAIETRLDEKAMRLRERAQRLPPGDERASVLREVHEIEKTRSMVDWINSPGLQPPS